MKVRYSILADASGSFGGLVASHNRSGRYIRTRVRPTNPASPGQIAIRTIFGNLAVAWSLLTGDQREAWRTYAANVPTTDVFGDTLHLTGHTMFVRSNVARLQAGLARVDDGPTVFRAAQLSRVTLTPFGDSNSLTMFVQATDPWTVQAGGALLVYVTRQNTMTVRYRRNPYRFATAILGPLDPPAPILFDRPAPFAMDRLKNNGIFTRFVAVTADGRISAPDTRGPTLIV